MDHQAVAQLLGNYGEFVGSIAVVVTLIFLTLQMRQNTRATRASLRQSISQTAISGLYVGIDDESFSDVFYRLWSKREEVTEAEELRFRRFMIAAFRSAENAFYQHRDGFYPDREWANTIDTHVAFLKMEDRECGRFEMTLNLFLTRITLPNLSQSYEQEL